MAKEIVLIGKRIRQLRQSSGLTVDVFCKRVGISKTTLFSYERGDRWPIAPAIIGICKTCGCSADFLLGLTNESPKIIDASTLPDKPYRGLRDLIEYCNEKPCE